MPERRWRVLGRGRGLFAIEDAVDQGTDARRAAQRDLRHAVGILGVCLRQRLQPVRAHLPRHDPGRRRVPQPRRRHPRARRARRRRQHDSPRHDAGGARHGRTTGGHALQPVSVRHDHRRAAPRVQRRRGATGDGSAGGADAPAGDGLRVDRHHVSADRRRESGPAALRAGVGARVSLSRGAVRELAHPDGGDSRHPVLADRGPVRHAAAGLRQQRLYADRARPADRPLPC